MNRILIRSEYSEISQALCESLAVHFVLADDAPQLILIAAKDRFSYFFSMKEQLQQEYPEVPMLFLWIEETCLHILSCGDLRRMDGKTIPRSQDSLLDGLKASIAEIQETAPANPRKLSDIQSRLQNGFPQSPKGAQKVEYDNFTSILHFVEQLSARSGQSAQILLLSLVPKTEGVSSPEEFSAARQFLSDAVRQTLRKQDVLTGCSESQMLVLLMDANDDGGHFAANRIYNTFLGLYDGQAYQLQYDIRSVGKTE